MQRTFTTGALAAALLVPATTWASDATAKLRAATDAALADAQTKTDFNAESLSAGHDGKFFLESPEGDFRLNISGQLQARYIANFRNGNADDAENGFGLRRTKFGFSGHVTQEEKFTYDIGFSVDDDGGETSLEDAKIGYKLADDLKVTLGQFKLPFAREELISSKRQLGADRSVATEFFTLDRSQGFQFDYTGIDNLKIKASLTDGFDNANNDFNNGNDDNSDLVLTARGDYKVFSEGKKNDRDVVAWEGQKLLQLGAAASWSIGDTDDDGGDFEQFTWTIDGLYKEGNFSFIGAFFGLHIDDDDTGSTNDFGLNLGAGYLIDDTIQPFIRYSYIDFDDEGELNAIEIGFNYFIKKHKAKFTLDAVIFLDELAPPGRFPNDPGSGIGVLDDAAGEDGQVALRAQYQLLF